MEIIKLTVKSSATDANIKAVLFNIFYCELNSN